MCGVRSARVTPARCARHNGLPFGLDHRIDQTDDGWPGIRTHVGALKILSSYATLIAGERGTHSTGSPIADLQRDMPWAAEHYPDADAVLDEIHRIHHHIARLTEHAPMLVGTCECGGRIYRYPTKRGLTDQSWCNICDRLYLTQGEAAWTRLLHVASLDVYVTRQDLKTIWPTLTDNRFDLWVHRGVIEPRAGKPKTYPLVVVNTRMNATHSHNPVIKC
ncbi:MAG: hypothetical protein E6244_10020 [Actinomyces sp.]|nr:hypothetical protein [Actinomyces sp.]